MKNKLKAFACNIGLLIAFFILSFLSMVLGYLIKYIIFLFITTVLVAVVGLIVFLVKRKEYDKNTVIHTLKADEKRFIKLLIISMPIEFVCFFVISVLPVSEIGWFLPEMILMPPVLTVLMLFAFKKKYIVFSRGNCLRNISGVFFTLAFIWASYMVCFNAFIAQTILFID